MSSAPPRDGTPGPVGEKPSDGNSMDSSKASSIRLARCVLLVVLAVLGIALLAAYGMLTVWLVPTWT